MAKGSQPGSLPRLASAFYQPVQPMPLGMPPLNLWSLFLPPIWCPGVGELKTGGDQVGVLGSGM